MKKATLLLGFMSAVLVAGPALLPISADASTAENKKDIAVFALGYHGRDIPLEALGGIDEGIRKVFADLDRFNVIGLRQRISAKGVEGLIEAIREAEESGIAASDEYRFGEAALAADEFARLLGAFIIALPVVSDFESYFDEAEGKWETDIATSFTFIDPASGGAVLGVARVESSGIDGEDQASSVSDAVEGIPERLQYELRKVEAFRLSARVLAASGKDVEIELGRSSGAKRGDEYAVVASGAEEAPEGGSELGLVAIRDVGQEVSKGRVLYSRIELGEEARLEEIPRLGVDLEPYFHLVVGRALDLLPDSKGSSGANAIAGLRVPIARGFYGLRPYGAVQVPANGIRGVAAAFMFPVDLLIGAEYRAGSSRLSVTPYCGAGIGCIYVSETVYGESADSSDAFIPHIGGHAYLDLAFLASRDIRIFADFGGEYWISTVTDLYTDYGGIGFGAGVAIKL